LKTINKTNPPKAGQPHQQHYVEKHPSKSTTNPIEPVAPHQKESKQPADTTQTPKEARTQPADWRYKLIRRLLAHC
jgi:hypothetical protein